MRRAWPWNGMVHAATMSRYRRVWVPGGTYFYTVNLLERRRTLLVDRVDALRDAFRAAHALRPFKILAITILPDHLHCVWRLPEGDADNATRWRHIKSTFSKNRGQSTFSNKRSSHALSLDHPLATDFAVFRRQHGAPDDDGAAVMPRHARLDLSGVEKQGSEYLF